MATPQLMIQPSSLMFSGIQIKQLNDVYLFRFTEELQARSEELLELSKAGTLTPEEEIELAGISELSRIFTFVNSKIAAQFKWSPEQLKQLYDNEPETSVNTAIPQNT
ncbi:MAG TPA: hypothetical protein DCE56_10015 [Cyanobacteria bacterium UBA8553]|nr:hypothetical protein [Cyanobacteria bacterium UBA8553]